MVYLIIGTILAIWFAIAGVLRVLKPRLMFYVTTVPITLLLTIGVFAGTIDDHLGYEHEYSVLVQSINGYHFYEFLFMKNWALSLLMICGAFLSYEIAKLITRQYKSCLLYTSPSPRD